jgi:signal transduction histidine kinase
MIQGHKKRGGRVIIISVKDTVCGMDSDITQGLLSKFADKSATGTGLGQFVSQNITEANGGRIWAKKQF